MRLEIVNERHDLCKHVLNGVFLNVIFDKAFHLMANLLYGNC